MFLHKLRGGEQPIPAALPLKKVVLASLGACIAIIVVALLAVWSSTPLILGSFGASSVLLFGYPDAPFSQPRNVFFGHVITAFLALLILSIFGPSLWSMALAVGVGIAAMMVLGAVHPPAGSNPIIIFLSQPTWTFPFVSCCNGGIDSHTSCADL